MNRICAVALLACFVVPLSVFSGDGKKGGENTNGVWVVVSGELGGKKLPEENFKNFTLTLKDGKYIVDADGKIDKGTYKAYLDKKPKALDVTGTEGPNKGKKFLAIFELKGNRMRVCYDLAGKKRPREFATKPDTSLFLVTYKRAKKKV